MIVALSIQPYADLYAEMLCIKLASLENFFPLQLKTSYVFCLKK